MAYKRFSLTKIVKILALMALTVVLVAGLTTNVGCNNVNANGNTNVNGDSEAPAGSSQAPEFQLNTLDGQTVRLSDFRGDVVLLNFWATWCGPCAMEMPYLQQVYEEWQGKGLVLLMVNIGESADKVAAFMQDHGLSVPVLLDSNGMVAAQYGIAGIPRTFLIDQDGIMRLQKIGAFLSVEEIEAGLRQYLPE
jgi:peroxiredoxin